MIGLLFFVIFCILCSVKIYVIYKQGWCKSKVCLSGKTVLVTGANTGIGYEACLEFAKRGARVILACRNLEKASKARDEIIALTENKNVIVKELKLDSFKSVRDFVKDIKENEERLDILVNNAGAGTITHKETEDGLQLLMQVNYFGPFLLTILLLDLLQKTGSSRIVNVSSILAQQSDLTVDTLNIWPGNHIINYGNSKLANILFTIKLSELLKGTNVTTYSLHPGAVATEIFRNVKGWINTILVIAKSLYFKNPEEGAQTTLYTALEQGIEKYSGQHFEECQRVSRYKAANDPDLVDQIWKETIKLVDCEEEVEKLFS